MKVIEDGPLDDLSGAVPVLSALGHCSTEPVAIASKIRSFTMPFLPPVALGCECLEFVLGRVDYPPPRSIALSEGPKSVAS